MAVVIKALHYLSPKWFAIFTWSMVVIIPSVIGMAFFEWYGFRAGVLLGILLLRAIIEHFIVPVPKKQALLIMNPLLTNESGEAVIRVVHSGWNFIYPWEQAHEDGCFSLERIRIPISEAFPAKDGPSVRIKGSITILPDQNNLVNYYLSQNIVNEKILDKVYNKISQIIATKKARAARNSIKKIDTQVTNYFATGSNNSEEEKEGTTVTSEIEKRHGITFENVTIDINYEDSYQKTLTTKARTKVLQEAAYDMQKKKSGKGDAMPATDAWNNVLVLEGGIKKAVHVQKIEGHGGDALAALFMAGANAMGGNKDSPRKSSKNDSGKEDRK